MLCILNMACFIVAKCKKWLMEPWTSEAIDPKHGLAYVPPKRALLGENKDKEAMRDAMTKNPTIDGMVEGMHLES